jgi:two-component system, response regulator PdtaR
MRVLIVEDDVLIAMHLAMLVAEFGHQVCDTARSAAEAIAKAATCDPDVVLMDIRLAEGSSGIEAAQSLHASRGLRCIILSGNIDAQTRSAVEPYDPVEFVSKPVVPVVLQRALAKVKDR